MKHLNIFCTYENMIVNMFSFLFLSRFFPPPGILFCTFIFQLTLVLLIFLYKSFSFQMYFLFYS
jgi:hypothetical protein